MSLSLKQYNFIIILAGILYCVSCGDTAVYSPKPRMYPKVHFPERGFSYFDTTICNFSFKFPTYGKIMQKKYIFEDRPAHPCWFDIQMDTLNATLHCSYIPIDAENKLSQLVNDAFKIVDEHNIKASYRRENIIENGNVKGIQFDIEGPVASAYQFYLTDNNRHFFRAALYLNSKVNSDSTQIVIDFIKKDLDSLVTTFAWK